MYIVLRRRYRFKVQERFKNREQRPGDEGTRSRTDVSRLRRRCTGLQIFPGRHSGYRQSAPLTASPRDVRASH